MTRGLVLLTGATGYVGSALVPLLVSAGYRVHALVQAADRAGAPAFVIHSAARIDYRWRDMESSRQVNVDGTRHLLEASLGRVQRFLFVSSVVTLGPARHAQELRDESSPCTAARLLEVPAPRWRIPSALWPVLTTALGLVDRLRPLERATPAMLRHLGAHYRFDASRARAELGWNPRPFDRVLDETVTWLRAQS